jgi:hypothetical protein
MHHLYTCHAPVHIPAVCAKRSRNLAHTQHAAHADRDSWQCRYYTRLACLTGAYVIAKHPLVVKHCAVTESARSHAEGHVPPARTYPAMERVHMH